MELFSKTSTTSVVAVLIVLLSFALLTFIVVGDKPANDTRATQIITGIFGVLMLMGGYYFGASKTRGGFQQTAENITNNAEPKGQEEDSKQ